MYFEIAGVWIRPLCVAAASLVLRSFTCDRLLLAERESCTTMKSPKRSGLAYLAEYQFGDDNVLTATFHEQQRLRNEERVRNAQPSIRHRDSSTNDDDLAINNAKRLQQDQGAWKSDLSTFQA